MNNFSKVALELHQSRMALKKATELCGVMADTHLFLNGNWCKQVNAFAGEQLGIDVLWETNYDVTSPTNGHTNWRSGGGYVDINDLFQRCTREITGPEKMIMICNFFLSLAKNFVRNGPEYRSRAPIADNYFSNLGTVALCPNILDTSTKWSFN
mgnify:FL=1